MTHPMQCVMGMQCSNFVIMAGDKINTKSIVVFDHACEKIHKITEQVMMAITGEPGDVMSVVDYIRANMKLYGMKNNYMPCTNEILHFVKKLVVENLYEGCPIPLNILLGGVDSEGTHLYIMDFLGCHVNVWYGVQGLGSIFCTTILDRYYRQNLTLYQAYEVLQECVKEIHLRFICNLSTFSVKALTKDGVIVLPDITREMTKK